MKSLFFFLSFAFFFQLGAQIDINKLQGLWCVTQITNAPDVEEPISEDELLELYADLETVIFCFAGENKFTMIDEDMTFDEAWEEALAYTYSKEAQTIEMHDIETNDFIRFYLIKVTTDELVFRVYDQIFGFEMHLIRCS